MGSGNSSPGAVFLEDSVNFLRRKSSPLHRSALLPAKLLLTSPPYYALTNYHYDPWLRLWLLGGRPDAVRSGEANRGKFEHSQGYRRLLEDVSEGCAPLLAKDAVIYVRTDRRPMTYRTTRSVSCRRFRGAPIVVFASFEGADADQPPHGCPSLCASASRRCDGHRLTFSDGAPISVGGTNDPRVVGWRSTRRGGGSSIPGGCGLLREILHGTGRSPARAL